MFASKKAWLFTTHSPRTIFSGYGSVVSGKDLIVAVDGGLSRINELQLIPDILIGDLDSLPLHLLEQYPTLLRKIYSTAKDFSDTELAIEWCLGEGVGELVICNDLGGRFDHALALLQNLDYLFKAGISASIESEAQRVIICGAHAVLSGMQGCTLSLLAWESNAVFNGSAGLAYPLEDIELTPLHPRGISNTILSEIAEFDLVSGRVLAIITKNI